MSDHPEVSSSVAHALQALLEWYAGAGVDAVLEEEPVDRFAASAAEKERRAARPPTAPAAASGKPGRPAVEAAPKPAATPGPVALPSTDAVMAARTAAASAGTLEELRALLAQFEGCNLRLTAKNLVFGDGNPAARLMFVGEAPGRDEDIEGRPFVGRSGQLLDRMLAAIGMNRAEHAYIANTIYWRPPGNREPSDVEVATCRPFILRQIELVDPDVLVLLGGQAAKTLLGGEAARAGIRKLRGRWLTYDTGRRTIPALPTYHPAYLLRTPIEKRLAWRDLLAVRDRMRGG